MQKINIESILNFKDNKSAREEVFKEGKLESGLLLYKPGQTTPEHKHPDIDEIFYVVSGQGTITINEEPISIKENDAILSPHEESHGFKNTSSEDLVVLQIKLTL